MWVPGVFGVSVVFWGFSRGVFRGPKAGVWAIPGGIFGDPKAVLGVPAGDGDGDPVPGINLLKGGQVGFGRFCGNFGVLRGFWGVCMGLCSPGEFLEGPGDIFGIPGRLGCPGESLGYSREVLGYLGDASDRAGDPVPGMNLLAAHGQRQRVQGDPGGPGGFTPNPGGPQMLRDPPNSPHCWICCRQGGTSTRPPPPTITGGLWHKRGRGTDGSEGTPKVLGEGTRGDSQESPWGDEEAFQAGVPQVIC